MNTPITDAFLANLRQEAHWSDSAFNKLHITSLARRLEKDREIFRQALIKIYTSQPGEAYQIALEAFREASEFPGEMHEP